MINSRYTIEYIEAGQTKKNSSGLRQFITYIFSAIILGVLGLFAYIIITGNSLPQAFKDPINVAQNYITLAVEKIDKSITTKNKTDTIEIEEEKNEDLKATETSAKIASQQAKIQALIAEKEKLTQTIKSLEQATTEKTTKYQKQIATNNTLTTQLKEKNQQLQIKKDEFASLKEKLEIQQIENETLSALLNATIKKYDNINNKQLLSQKVVKHEATLKPIEKEEPNKKKTATAQQATPIEKITAEINESIAQTQETNLTNEKEASSHVTKAGDKQSGNEIADNTEQKQNRSQVDAIIEAMEKAQSRN